MGLELDWLEREERYRRRVVRLVTVAVLLVAAVVGALAFTRARATRRTQAEAARTAVAARAAEVKRQRDAFVADSSAAANRYSGFLTRLSGKPVEGLPLIEIPLPAGVAIRPFVEKLWTEYVQVVDPRVTSDQETTWYRQYYVDVLNDGPLRGHAALLPALKQEGTRLAFAERYGFAEITRGQVAVGMREAPVEEAPADSAAATGEPPTSTPDEAPPATTTAPPAAPPPPPPTPPAADSTPSAPVPAAPAPDTIPPAPPPAPAPEPVPPPEPAPADTTPKP